MMNNPLMKSWNTELTFTSSSVTKPLQNRSKTCYTTFAHSTMGDAQKEMQNAHHHDCSSVQHSGVLGLSRPVIHN